MLRSDLMKVGIRAHDVQIFDNPEQLARKLEELGFSYLQFAPRASLPETTDTGKKVNYGLAQTINNIFTRHNLQIAVLGCYVNIIDPDISKRNSALQLFSQYLTMARYFGSNLVGTETGSVDPNFNLTTKNYEAPTVNLAVSQIEKLVKIAEKTGTLIGIEPGVNHPIHSIKVMETVLQQIQSPNLQVILDMANLVTDSTQKISTILQQALNTFGNKIYCYHIKDYVFKNGRIQVVPIGEGIADIKETLTLINSQQPHSFVILDETPQRDFFQSLTRIQEITKNI